MLVWSENVESRSAGFSRWGGILSSDTWLSRCMRPLASSWPRASCCRTECTLSRVGWRVLMRRWIRTRRVFLVSSSL